MSMNAEVMVSGSAPPPPSLFVGRAEDQKKLRALLTRHLRTEYHRSVRLLRELLQIERTQRSMTQEALAQRAGFSIRVIKKAEGGEPISRITAESVAQVLGKPLSDFLMPSGDSASAQVLTVVHGWPGVGKTTVARSLAHDDEIKRAFPDGVLWASLGQSPNLLAELTAWGRALGANDINQEVGGNEKEGLDYASGLSALICRGVPSWFSGLCSGSGRIFWLRSTV